MSRIPAMIRSMSLSVSAPDFGYDSVLPAAARLQYRS
jgi:hypothetical protein